jgi:WD40 repeat protein
VAIRKPKASPTNIAAMDPRTIADQISKAYGQNSDLRQAAEAKVGLDWRVGDVILDLYQVNGILGEGGMGKVYRVHHLGWDIDLAVKSPKPEQLKQAGGSENFIRECETWVDLGLHPNIVSCYYVRTLGGIPRVFAEFVDGGSLKDWIDQRRLYQGGGSAVLERMLDVAIQSAHGLDFAHTQGLVHQDMKSANVMVTMDGIAKITDFGLAKARGASGASPMIGGQSILVSSGGFTPAYCSPEQALHAPLTRKTDIWSWGLSVLEMFAGEVTWMAGQAADETLSGYQETGPEDDNIPVMPGGMVELLHQCFRKEPDERPRDMGEIIARLQEIYSQNIGHPYTRQAPLTTVLEADSVSNKALSLYDLGRMPEAEALWQSNLERNSGHLESTYNLGLVRWRASKIDDAALLRDLGSMAFATGDWRGAWSISQVHLERGDVEQARKIIDAQAIGSPESPEIAILIRHLRGLSNDGRSLLRTYTGHQEEDNGEIVAVCLSEDGRQALSAYKRIRAEKYASIIYFWDTETGNCLRTLPIKQFINAICLSPDGRYTLSGGGDGIQLWDLATGVCERDWYPHGYIAPSISMTPDNRFAVFVRRHDSNICLWDISAQECIREFAGHTGRVDALCLSPDGRYILSGSHLENREIGKKGSDRTMRLWDVATGKCLRSWEAWKGHNNGVTSLAISGDGQYAVSGARDCTVKLWELSTGRCLQTFGEHHNVVNSVAMSQDGKTAISGSSDGVMKLWETSTGRCLRTFFHNSKSVNLVSISRNGEIALSGCEDRSVRVWSLNSGYRYVAPLMVAKIVATDNAAKVKKLIETARQAQATMDVSGEIHALRQARSIPGYEHNPEVMHEWSNLYSRARRTTFRGGWLVRTYGVNPELGPVAIDMNNFVDPCLTAIRMSEDGEIALVLDNNNDLSILNMASGEYEWILVHFGYSFSKAIQLNWDGRLALAVMRSSSGDAISIWETASGYRLAHFHCNKVDVASASFTPNHKLIISATLDIGEGEEGFTNLAIGHNIVRLWDIDSGKCRRMLKGHETDVKCIKMGNDGCHVLSGDGYGELKYWDASTGKCLWSIAAHIKHINSLDISCDGRFGLSGGDDQTVKEWDLLSGNCLRTFSGHTNVVNSVCLDAGGRYGFSGSKDSTIKVWDLETGLCVRTLTGHKHPVETIHISGDGRLLFSLGDGKIFKWILDWDLDDSEPVDWDERARPHLNNFLALHSGRNIFGGWKRPSWRKSDFEKFLLTLRYAGYGRLKVEGVGAELKRSARHWAGQK